MGLSPVLSALIYYILFSFHSAQNYSAFLRPNLTDSFKTSEVAFLDHELVAEYFDLLL